MKEASRRVPTVKAKNAAQLTETQRTLPIVLLRAREAVLVRLRPMLSGDDVTEQQWRILRVLQEKPDLEAKQVADLACIHPSSVTRILKTLDSKGLVEIGRSKTDGRSIIINISDNGVEFIGRMSRGISDAYREIENLVGREFMDDLLDKLEIVINRLNK